MKERLPGSNRRRQVLEDGRDLVALVALAFVGIVFFWPVLFAGYWLPQGGGDLTSFLFPMYRFIAHELQSGQIPLWNPHQVAGAPLVGDNQAGLLYPPNVLLFLVRPDFPYAGLEGMVMIHLWWAGAAMYLMLRGWSSSPRLGRTACLLGAVAFMLNDVFITHLGNANLNAALSWLPLALLGLHRGAASPTWRAACAWLLLAAVTLALGLLAGHGQAGFLVVACLTIYALQLGLMSRRGDVLAAWAATIGLGCGLAAASLLPTIALLPLTVRAGLSPGELSRFSLSWPALTGLWAPGFFGRGSHDFWGWWDRVEVGYLGVLPWLLALVALARWPRRALVFPVLLTTLGLLLALGPNTFVYRALVSPFGLPFRAPARFLVLFALGLAMLAAFGADWLCRARRPQLGRLLVGASVTGLLLAMGLLGVGVHVWTRDPGRHGQMLAAVMAFVILGSVSLAGLWLRDGGRLSRRAMAALALGMLVMDLVALGSRVEVDRQDPTVGFGRTVALGYLRDHAGLDRIETATGLWQPGAAQMHGLYAMDGVYNPLALGIYAYYLDGLRYRGSPAYDLMGTRYIVATKDEPPSDQPDIRPIFDADPAVRIYENGGALPRLRFVTRSEVIEDESAAYARLHDPAHDARGSVVLLGGEPQRGPAGGAAIDEVVYGANEIRLRLRCDRAGYLVLSDTYHPGWRASVDGARVPVLRADFAFRAVAVPAGDHRLRMWYEPPLWPLGIAVSVVSAVATAVGGLACARGGGPTRGTRWPAGIRRPTMGHGGAEAETSA